MRQHLTTACREPFREQSQTELTTPLLKYQGPVACTIWIAFEVERQDAEARAYVKEQGWNVLGRLAAMNVSPYRCAKSWQELGKLVPTIAAGRGQTEARIKAIAELRAFRAAYRAALERWKAGDREVVFPAGTYWMRVHHGARVESFN